MSGLDLLIVSGVKSLIAYWSTAKGLSSFLTFLIIGGYGATALEQFKKAKEK